MSRSDLSAFVFSFVLVWSGREMGGLSMVVWFSISVFGLVWFSIRGSCQSLSLIENHIYVACFPLCFVGGYFLFSVFVCLHQTELFRLFLCCFVIQCSVLIIIKNHEHLLRCALVLTFFHRRQPLQLRYCFGQVTCNCNWLHLESNIPNPDLYLPEETIFYFYFIYLFI